MIVITKRQLDAMRASRSKLTPELHLTPNNANYGYIRSALDRKRERTIQVMEQKLGENSKMFRQQFAKSRNLGKAKYQFNKTKEIKL